MSSEDDSQDTHDAPNESGKSSWLRRSFNPFRIATLRGLAVVLPPLLTIMVFVWAWTTIDRTILRPVESLVQNCVAWSIEDIRENEAVQDAIVNANPPGAMSREENGQKVFLPANGRPMVQVGNNQWIPQFVANKVNENPAEDQALNGHAYYKRYVELRYLKRHLVIPALLAFFLAIMYLVGKLLAVGIGRIFWRWFESLINRLPIIRNVYSSVKQVTDFAFSENNIEFNRVVAVEYPRKGIWSIGFVTGEGFIDIRKAVGEPMLSVLMPTSPMPATGFTVTVPKSETIELDITIDQAIQFCVSCGVVVPEQQMTKSALEGEFKRRAAKLQHASSESDSSESAGEQEE